MSKRKTLPDLIRAAIDKSGKTRYLIAKESGVHQAVLGRFVRDERDLNLRTADRLCRVLGLELRPVKKPAK